MDIVVNPHRREWDKLLARSVPDDSLVRERVVAILERVRTGGDDALHELTIEIEGVELDSLIVPDAEISAAHDAVDDHLKRALDIASANIRRFHEAQQPSDVDIETMPGVRCVQRSLPLRRVGLYVPGGSAPLFSTVLMLAIPASVARCQEVVLCTPPGRDGKIAPEILYAASLCGVDRIYKLGGAQAIAAMAYGTGSVGRVDKIFGPGNRYVTCAKQIVGGVDVAIDMPAGPSEVMVLADSSADPVFVAADLLSQAEHGADSQAILVTTSRGFAERVSLEVAGRLDSLERGAVARMAIDRSRIIVLDSPGEIIEMANEYAPEHLIVSMDDPWGVASRVFSAGSIFIGNYTPESAGDYASGTNHTLPTSGWARVLGGVSTESFMRRTTLQEITREGLGGIAPVIIAMADAEGLDAHAGAVKVRLSR